MPGVSIWMLILGEAAPIIDWTAPKIYHCGGGVVGTCTIHLINCTMVYHPGHMYCGT